MKTHKRDNNRDRELVRRIRGGDFEAFSGLVRDYSPLMLNLATGIVRRRDAAEDVVQEAFVKAYEKLASWRGEGSLSTWLYRIVYTTAVSSLRGQGFDKPVSGSGLGLDGRMGLAVDAETLADSHFSDDGDGDWELTEENIALMHRALEQLPPLDRALVNLFYIDDKPVREVAAICDMSEGSIKTRLHRIRHHLKKLMRK